MVLDFVTKEVATHYAAAQTQQARRKAVTRNRDARMPFNSVPTQGLFYTLLREFLLRDSATAPLSIPTSMILFWKKNVVRVLLKYLIGRLSENALSIFFTCAESNIYVGNIVTNSKERHDEAESMHFNTL